VNKGEALFPRVPAQAPLAVLFQEHFRPPALMNQALFNPTVSFKGNGYTPPSSRLFLGFSLPSLFFFDIFFLDMATFLGGAPFVTILPSRAKNPPPTIRTSERSGPFFPPPHLKSLSFI